MSQFQKITVVDSHTAGEPTRVVLSGGPALPEKSAAEKLAALREQDHFRTAIVCEPRGSDVLVGALLLEPLDPANTAGVIFFNNVGYLGMCGHGTIGLIATLAYLGRIGPGDHRLETPVGPVLARLHESGDVSVQNVPAFRFAKSVSVDVPGHGPVTGDIAWGGNWFFLVGDHGQALRPENVDVLTDWTWRVRQALAASGITGAGGAEIDHIELYGPPTIPGAGAHNFVLCPGKAYDRSPCGTGTSAKLACLYADGHLKEGQQWRQEGILGTFFEGSVRVVNDQILPTITGRAFITAEATLLYDPADPFLQGITHRV